MVWCRVVVQSVGGGAPWWWCTMVECIGAEVQLKALGGCQAARLAGAGGINVLFIPQLEHVFAAISFFIKGT